MLTWIYKLHSNVFLSACRLRPRPNISPGLHPLGIINVCNKFHADPSRSYNPTDLQRDISRMFQASASSYSCHSELDKYKFLPSPNSNLNHQVSCQKKILLIRISFALHMCRDPMYFSCVPEQIMTKPCN